MPPRRPSKIKRDVMIDLGCAGWGYRSRGSDVEQSNRRPCLNVTFVFSFSRLSMPSLLRSALFSSFSEVGQRRACKSASPRCISRIDSSTRLSHVLAGFHAAFLGGAAGRRGGRGCGTESSRRLSSRRRQTRFPDCPPFSKVLPSESSVASLSLFPGGRQSRSQPLEGVFPSTGGSLGAHECAARACVPFYPICGVIALA